MEYSVENLQAIKRELPHGALAEIAEKTSYTRSYISALFRGVVPMSDKHLPVIRTATAMIRKHREEKEKVLKELKELAS